MNQSANRPDNPYRRTGHRISLLPVTRYCGKAATLSEAHGGNRHTAIGRAGHAFLSKEPGWEALLDGLDPKEREEVLNWQTPTTISFLDHENQPVTLDYADAHKEVPLGLDDFGFYTDPNGSDTLTRGDMDFGWAVRGTAYVVDIKRTRWSAFDGEASLQLASYGLGFSQKQDCLAYVPGLWVAQEGIYRWGPRVELGSLEARESWRQIHAAATQPTLEYSTGPHCSTHCYSRLHCPEYVLPALAADSILGPVASGGPPTEPGELGRLLAFLDRWDEVSEAARKQVRELIRRGTKVSVDGKTYRPAWQEGRTTLDQKKLRAELGEDIERFMKKGAPFETFRWVKE